MRCQPWKRLGTAFGCAVALLAPATAGAATAPGSNWAGYVVTAEATSFTSVTATWQQPAAACTKAGSGASAAFWVGLGGSSPNARALEQAGTTSTCGSSGVSTYRAWYEIVPGSPVTVNVLVKPGDTITSSVNVLADGTVVLFQIKNRTTKKVFTTRVPLTSTPDLSSADWIAEAPTKCAEIICLPVPLQRFGSVSFSNIAALGNGIGGTLTHLDWTPTSVQLVPSTVLVSSPSTAGPAAGAVPGGVTPDGSSFEVTWVPNGHDDAAAF